MPDAVNGNSFYLYLVLLLAIQPLRPWSNVKQIKDGKHSNFGGASLEKRSILYSSAMLNEAQIRANHSKDEESNVFSDDDIK